MTAVIGWAGVGCTEKPEVSEILSQMTGAAVSLVDFQKSLGKNALVAARKPYGRLICGHAAGWHVVFVGSVSSSDPILNQQIKDCGVEHSLVERFTTTGTEFLAKLSGHFVLAMVRDDGCKALLAVDRFGVDPLCYAHTGTGVVFASKPVWVVRHPVMRSKIAPQSIFNYLYFHMIPSPGTLFDGVSKLEPGCSVVLDGGVLKAEPYWQPIFHNEQDLIPQGYKDQFLNLVHKGVEVSVDGSETTGCFLSGGTDSSTIAGMLGRVTGKPARTFSIGFASQGFDETEYSRIAARHFATDHHEYYVTADDVVAAVPAIAADLGEPFGNSSVVPTYYCAKLAREHGVQRLLGGDGGDELFGGNERYAKQLLFSVYDQIPSSLKARLLEPLLLSSGCKRLPLVGKLSSYVNQARLGMPDRMETYNLLINLGVNDVMESAFVLGIDQERPINLLRQVYRQVKSDTLVNRMLAMDFKFTLADNDLPKVKGMCDLAGVDVEFPLLDSPLVDFSLGLPVAGKVRHSHLRPFFKQSLQGFLPEAILTKSKHGFGLPFGPWLQEHKALHELAFDALTDFKSRHILSATFIDDLTNRRITEHASYYGTLVWVVMMLEYWLASHDVNV